MSGMNDKLIGFSQCTAWIVCIDIIRDYEFVRLNRCLRTLFIIIWIIQWLELIVCAIDIILTVAQWQIYAD